MRVSFLVDGFNLYHSVKSAERNIGGARLRWLDLYGLCETLVRSSYPVGTVLESVHYFSALAKHLQAKKPEVVQKHRTLISAFTLRGVEVHLARFKKKENYHRLNEFKIQLPPLRRWFRLPLPWVRTWHRSHEEKETDVAIACKLLELLCQNRCEAAVIMSGDADLAPAIRTAKILYPSASVAVAFPFDRQTRDLEQVASRVFRINAQLYQTHQLPPILTPKKGKPIVKPASW